MNSLHTIFNFRKNVLLLLFVLLAANTSLLASTKDVAVAAKLSKEESMAIASKVLSRKLQTDLVLKNVSIKFNKADQYFVSGTQVGVKGEGVARLDNEANELPLYFDVKIDANRLSPVDVKYVFLNMEGGTSANAALTTEDVVTEKLLQQLRKDYKTENVVVAIEFLKEQTLENGEKGFTGGGEVRLNGMDWQKISFDVRAADEEKTKISIAKYLIK